jgi:indole-3-glycerol phosphate synthase
LRLPLRLCAFAGEILLGMNVLSEILSKKRQRIIVARSAVPCDQMRRKAQEERRHTKAHALRSALQADGINIIAEFKRRSPSKGTIRADANLADMVTSYEAGGAVALSVLTEEDYFDGSLNDLRSAKSTVTLPVLRKDFVFEDYQVYESAAAGADAILLIVAALDDAALSHLRQLAEDELHMDALVEVHTSEELKRAQTAGATLIGVNNRDLRTFTVSLDTSLALAREASPEALLISESGLHSASELQRLRAAGYHGFLIGETLMRAEDPAEMLRDLRRL